MHRSLATVLAIALTLISVVPAIAATPARHTSSAYHDAAFDFSYPDNWVPFPRALLQQAVVSLGGAKQEMRVTDVGGVSNGSGTTFQAGVLVVRLRLTHQARSLILTNRSAVLRGILNGIARTTGRVLHRGPASVAGAPGREIESVQGPGAGKIHQRIYVVLSTNSKRLFLVYLLAKQADWASEISTFDTVVASMKIQGS